MSRFIEKLEKVGQRAPEPVGFTAMSRSADNNPAIMVIGIATPDQLSGKSALTDAKFDAVLVALDSLSAATVKKVGKPLEDQLWGARVKEINSEQAALLKENGCDFIVFGAENTSATVLNDEDLGFILNVGAEFDEDTAQNW